MICAAKTGDCMKVCDKTVLAKLNVTEAEIARRRELAGLDNSDGDVLLKCKPVIEEELESIIEEYYRIQYSDRDILDMVGDEENLRRLHDVQRQYVVDLFCGNTDMDYVNDRLCIGVVHKQVGVEPKLYLSAVKNLKDLLIRTLQRRIADPVLLARASQAVDKQLHFDMTLVVDTYTHSLVSEMESARERVESYAAELEAQVVQRTRELEEKVNELQAALAMVKKLQGVIPICGICKKIRNDEESWEQLEQYLTEHSEALFSHGLCPDCFERELVMIREMRKREGER